MEAVTEKTVEMYGDELDRTERKIKVETLNYNCIDVRGFRDDGETWLFFADLQPFFDRHINAIILTTPENQRRRYKKEQLFNPGSFKNGVSGVRVLRESYFLDLASIRKKDQKPFVCYQCGREIQQGPIVKRKFSVSYDGATEKRTARFHYLCFGG